MSLPGACVETLRCPRCQSGHLRIQRARLTFESASLTRNLIVGFGEDADRRVYIKPDNPSAQSDSVAMRFACGCGHIVVLEIVQGQDGAEVVWRDVGYQDVQPAA